MQLPTYYFANQNSLRTACVDDSIHSIRAGYTTYMIIIIIIEYTVLMYLLHAMCLIFL